MNRPALVPELYVSDLSASLEFYVDVLGFGIEYERPTERFAALSLGGAHIMLEEATSVERATPEEFRRGQWRSAKLEKPFGRGLNLDIRIDGIEAANDRIVAKGYPLVLDVHERRYRVGSGERAVRQLLVADPDGYLIRLSEFLAG